MTIIQFPKHSHHSRRIAVNIAKLPEPLTSQRKYNKVGEI
jgi:hypothetical protein